MSGTNPPNESVLGGGTARVPLLTGTPDAGASSHAPPTPDMFHQFFTQHSAQLQQMFAAQFSPPQPNQNARPQRASKRHLTFPSRSPSIDRSSRSKTPPEPTLNPPYVHRTRTGKGVTGTPFVGAIANFATPHDFKIPSNIKLYNGTTDPDDHLNTYVNTMNIYAPQMPIWCKVFPATLTDKARLWFEKLPPGSISSYDELEQQFRAHFSQMKRFQKTKAEFMAIRQGESEPLRQFITRFNSESLQLADRSEDFLISAFINGLRHGQLYRDLISTAPTSLESLLQQADDFVRADEADRKKREDNKRHDKSEGRDSDRRPGRRSVLDRLGCSRSSDARSPQRDQFTSLRKTPTEIFALTKGKGILRTPLKMLTPAYRRSKEKFCNYHDDHGHDTDDCIDLKREIEMCLQNGHLSQFAKDVRKPEHHQDRADSRGRSSRQTDERPQKDSRTRYDWSRHKNEASPSRDHDKRPIGEILTIAGGPAGGKTNSARRARCRRMPDPPHPSRNLLADETITFSADDPIPDRNSEADALIIRATIANKLVHRVYVDPGSSAEIMYWRCFEQLDEAVRQRLQPAQTPLVDFANRAIWPEGSITLPVTFGEHPAEKLVYLDFLVIKAPSPYNVLIGRPALSRLKAIVSTLHLLIKFPTTHGVAVIRGDQQLARECYRVALQRANDAGPSTTPTSLVSSSQNVLFISSARRREFQSRRTEKTFGDLGRTISS